MKLLGILAFLCGIYFVYSKRDLVFAGKHVTCTEFSKKYFYNFTCGIKLVNRNKQTYSLHVSLKPVVINNIRIRMISYYKFRTQYHPHGIFTDEDACSYMKFLKGTLVIDLSKFLNLPEEIFNITCPIKGPRNLTISNFEIVPSHLTDYVNIGDWIFESITYTVVDKKEIILSNVKNYFGTSYVYTKT